MVCMYEPVGPSSHLTLVTSNLYLEIQLLDFHEIQVKSIIRMASPLYSHNFDTLPGLPPLWWLTRAWNSQGLIELDPPGPMALHTH